ncbi:DUF4349 domain-containing protein [Flavobacterium sp.]|uniref:DUF4349 domain-containing protein n=1 Tax=Flavobacterium sp. TaxID=239 RepID=UPI002615311D|nr:DUF4349 domain-containing protein [Flavobacterium sp.]MDD2984868.1 DUF4349 domain-containing protein [Flavobacterium sp.]
MKIVLAYLSFLVLPLMCGGNPNSNVYDSENAVEDIAVALEEPKSVENFEVETEQKIIKESTLHFETQDLQATYQQVTSAIVKHKAFLQSDTEGKDYNSIYRNLTVRIPTAAFDAFLADIGKGVAYFDRKEISAKDVTAEFIDIEARLKAKKILEERYLALLQKANKVSEILEIEKELSIIREEIEAKEGQLNYLQNRVSLSTVNIEFYKKVAQSEDATVSYGSKMWNAVKSGWNGISSFFIGLLHIWPFILILVALIFVIKRQLKKKKQ